MLKNFGKFMVGQIDLKNRRSNPRADGDTRPLPKDLSDTGKPPVKMASSKYRVATCQSSGKERLHNEDTVYTITSHFGGLEESNNFGIFLVADGMGGHKGGELASKLAAYGSSKYLFDRVYEALVFESKVFPQEEIKQWLIDAVDEAQKLVLSRVPGGGTTLTLVLATEENFYFAHVGDSRLYLAAHDGTLKLKTRDHSLVKRLIELGEISETEAETFPQKNILYRALGQTDPFEADIGVFTLEIGERLLLCSDGLWGAIKFETINQLIYSEKDLESIASQLVQSANEAGGFDNISVVLIERVK